MDSKSISLTKGFVTIVDGNDYDWLNQWKWHYSNGYAAKAYHLGMFNGKQKMKTIFMHRVINSPLDGMQVDHINGDKLDNRRNNLRNCTNKENIRNQKRQNRKRSSQYKGVHWCSTYKIWVAQIEADKVQYRLGSFTSESKAAMAYNEAALKYHGNFARLNKIF